MTIALTTSTGANFAVYAPPAEKTYVIYNASSYVATIYNSTVLGNTTAAGTGVAIPAGKTMTVWSEGTNFAVQNSHIIGTVVGNVTGNLTGNVTGQLDGSISSATTAVTQAPGTSNTTVATTAFANSAFQGAYPVGSIYMNASVATNPATLLGFGTWVSFGAGRVLVGFDAGNPLFDTAEETGGSANAITVSHTHTATSTSTVSDPGHEHEFYPKFYGAFAGEGDFVQPASTYTGNRSRNTGANTTGISVSTSTSVASSGSSGTNANYQPYITVYMWKRTA
jgi:hypothetical protein